MSDGWTVFVYCGWAVLCFYYGIAVGYYIGSRKRKEGER